jgi:hypothetical protein
MHLSLGELCNTSSHSPQPQPQNPAYHVPLHAQENYFFDGSKGELNSKRVVLRVRFYDTDKKARLTLKVGPCRAVMGGRPLPCLLRTYAAASVGGETLVSGGVCCMTVTPALMLGQVLLQAPQGQLIAPPPCPKA